MSDKNNTPFVIPSTLVVGEDGKLSFVPGLKLGGEKTDPYGYCNHREYDVEFGLCAVYNRLGRYLGTSLVRYGNLLYLISELLPGPEALFLVPVEGATGHTDLDVEDMVRQSVYCATHYTGWFFSEATFLGVKRHFGQTHFRVGHIDCVRNREDFLEMIKLANSTCISPRCFFGGGRHYGISPLYDREKGGEGKIFDIHNCQFYSGNDGSRLGTRDLDDTLLKKIIRTVPCGEFVLATFEGVFPHEDTQEENGSFEAPSRSFFRKNTLMVFYNGKAYCKKEDCRWHKFYKVGDVVCEMDDTAFQDLVLTLCISVGIK